jgi:hypothetical protein
MIVMFFVLGTQSIVASQSPASVDSAQAPVSSIVVAQAPLWTPGPCPSVGRSGREKDYDR